MDINTSIYNGCAIIGAATLGLASLKVISNLLFHLRRSRLQRYQHGSEPWALVTGASDGIGLGFVHQLAQRGFNVILHGRNEAKLKKVVEQLQSQYSTGFRIMILDARAPADAVFEKIVLSTVQGLNLTVIIHNIGGGPAGVEMRTFKELNSDLTDGWIDINARFTTHITRLLLPVLSRNTPGLMLYVSSGVTEFTVPGVSLYTGAKSYIESFVKCLKLELKMDGTDVEVMALICGTVATASSGRSEMDIGFTMPSPQTFANASLNKVGCGKAKVAPHFGHWLQLGLMASLPGWLGEQMVMMRVRKVLEQMERKK